MGVIYLLRHAQAPAAAYGSSTHGTNIDHALTELGREQSARAGIALAARAERIDFAVSGCLPRQRLTMDIGMRSYSQTPTSTPTPPVEIDPRWDEYDIDAILGGDGRAASMSGPALQAIVDAALADWVQAREPHLGGSESYAAYRQRCAAALDSVRELASSGKTVAVTSSAGTITQILAHVWGLDGDQWIRMSRTMINASISKLIVGRGGVSVVSMNEHAHLEGAVGGSAHELMSFR